MTPHARTMLVLLAAVHVMTLVAEPVAPCAPEEQHRAVPYAPPTRVRLVDASGAWHLRPFVYAVAPVAGAFGRYAEDRRARFTIRLFPHGAPYRLLGMFDADRHLVGVDAPGGLFLLGTDRYGRDVLSRLLVGARLSLFAGLLGASLALGLGLLVGGASGYYAGRVDAALMAVADTVLALPWIYLLIGARSLLPLDLPPERAFLLVVALVGVLGWARPARLVRAAAMSVRGRDYILAARSSGASQVRILVRHVLPHTLPVVATQAALLVPRYVLAEITLSFLGLGVAEPSPSWGTLAAAMLPAGAVLSHWWLATPLVAIVSMFVLYDRVAATLATPATAVVGGQ